MCQKYRYVSKNFEEKWGILCTNFCFGLHKFSVGQVQMHLVERKNNSGRQYIKTLGYGGPKMICGICGAISDVHPGSNWICQRNFSFLKTFIYVEMHLNRHYIEYTVSDKNIRIPKKYDVSALKIVEKVL